MIFQNDPIETMIKTVKGIYPETQALIKIFDYPDLVEGVGRVEAISFSSIKFPKDGGIPLIKIAGNVSFDTMEELLCRQLSSAVMGEVFENEEVDEIWEQQWFSVHQNIMREYKKLSV